MQTLKQAQDHSLATLAPILTREDGLVDFSRPAQQIYNRWRGFQPWPGAHTTLRGKKLILQKTHLEREIVDAEPGALRMRGDAILVVCGGGTLLHLDEVQIEGKRRMNAADFFRGFQLKDSERLGR